ncbi:MAG: tRNA 2-thiouridine(34) synthase MnmA [Candidatus Omnitrophica bacterium]|nr:tRNA 2-thiouridine(34) synthase MnmA [Candidatus Omnitrophota bacterium]
MPKGKVLIAISGGVDSSYAALCLKESGYNVEALTMITSGKDKDILESAGSLCRYLGIKHRILDLSETFKKEIIGYFIRDYQSGRTPNPCIRCNRIFKFGTLYQESLQDGFDFFATGHYAQTISLQSGYFIKTAKDTAKDQSYFLYSIKKEFLSRIIFPLGSFLKSDVVKLAKKSKIPFSKKGPSQDLCFAAKNNLKNISEIKGALEGADIVDSYGNILGINKSPGFYTVGQRKGLGISHKSALYILNIDCRNNKITVGSKSDLLSSGLRASESNLLGEDLTGEVFAKIRYKHNPARCKISIAETGRLTVMFKEPQYAVTPGQSAVLYKDNIVLGGGIIEEAIE